MPEALNACRLRIPVHIGRTEHEHEQSERSGRRAAAICGACGDRVDIQLSTTGRGASTRFAEGGEAAADDQGDEGCYYSGKSFVFLYSPALRVFSRYNRKW